MPESWYPAEGQHVGTVVAAEVKSGDRGGHYLAARIALDVESDNCRQTVVNVNLGPYVSEKQESFCVGQLTALCGLTVNEVKEKCSRAHGQRVRFNCKKQPDTREGKEGKILHKLYIEDNITNVVTKVASPTEEPTPPPAPASEEANTASPEEGSDAVSLLKQYFDAEETTPGA